MVGMLQLGVRSKPADAKLYYLEMYRGDSIGNYRARKPVNNGYSYTADVASNVGMISSP
jgi:hypothetical protein